MTVIEGAKIAFELIKALAGVLGLNEEDLMAELAKRHTIDGSDSDAAAAEQDSHMLEESDG